jgi:short-subunit dehydrogenase
MTRRILVTGASRGIGRAIAVRLANPDTPLLLHGRNSNELEQTAALAQKKGAQTEILICDLADVKQVEATPALLSSNRWQGIRWMTGRERWR